MEVDSSKTVIKDRKLMYIMVFALIAIVSTFFMADTFDKPVFGFNREFYILLVTGIYLFINIFRFSLNLNYISYSDAGGKIIIKYYSLRPFMQKRRTVEIPKGTLFRFEFKKSMFGQKKSLILFQMIKNKVAKYPEISLSALNSVEIGRIKGSLKSLAIDKGR